MPPNGLPRAAEFPIRVGRKLFMQPWPNKSVLVTATPPTPNGALHLGHLSGPYLSADIYRRFLELSAVDCMYVSGSDDHQSYTQAKGIQLGWSPERVADHFAGQITEALDRAAIRLDAFIRPRAFARHIPFVQGFFLKLFREDKLRIKEAPTLFCTRCDRFLFEAFVSGLCPHCNAPAGGNVCEDCGWPNDCVDLIEPRCKLCGGIPSVRNCRRIYFPLSDYTEQLAQFHRSAVMNSHVRCLCENLLESGLPDISITHATDWGIEVPVSGFEELRMYAWFEMAPGYLAAAEFAHGARKSTTTNSHGGWADCHIVQFFGFDNSYFHALLFPALIMAYDPTMPLPKAFITNEFYRLNGAKFSTSRGHAIWAHELLSSVESDALRFYLAVTGPEREQTNFALDDMASVTRRDLIDGWQHWLQKLGRRAHYAGRGAPALTTLLEVEQTEFARRIHDLVNLAAESYELVHFSPQSAVRSICEIVRLARRFGENEEAWRSVKGRERRFLSSLALELYAAKAVALLAAPITPSLAEHLWRSLGFDGPIERGAWQDLRSLVTAGQQVGSLEHFVALPSASPSVFSSVAGKIGGGQ
jgi:methionyl-tRNA synthetase